MGLLCRSKAQFFIKLKVLSCKLYLWEAVWNTHCFVCFSIVAGCYLSHINWNAISSPNHICIIKVNKVHVHIFKQCIFIQQNSIYAIMLGKLFKATAITFRNRIVSVFGFFSDIILKQKLLLEENKNRVMLFYQIVHLPASCFRRGFRYSFLKTLFYVKLLERYDCRLLDSLCGCFI